MIFVGIDWSEQHDEVEVQAESGEKLKALKVRADLAGLTRFHEAIAALAEEPSQIAIGIEANHGLWVNALVASGYLIYPIKPLTSARNREGDSPAGSKSDRGDARMLATLVRTKRDRLRPLAGDSVQAQAIQIRARSHVRAIRVSSGCATSCAALKSTAAVPLSWRRSLRRWDCSQSSHVGCLCIASFASGIRAERLAVRLGPGTDPVLAPRQPLRRMIEVYPHPAKVSLFGLRFTLKYKAKRGRDLS